MKCFEDIIEIDSGSHPLSDLPGISIDNSASADPNGDGEALINQAKRNAARKLFQSISEHYSPAIKPRSLINPDTMGERSPWGVAKSNVTQEVFHQSAYGYFQEDQKVDTSTPDKWGGIRMDSVTRAHTYINIVGVSLYSATTGDRTVKVVNVLTGEVIDTLTVAAVADRIVTKDIDIKVRSNSQQLSIAVIADRTEGDVYRATMTPKSCCNNRCVKHHALHARSVRFAADTFLHANAKANSTTSGLAVNMVMGCDLDGYVCQYAKIYTYPMAYLTGAELMKLMRSSTRKNCITIVHGQDWKDLHDEFMDEARRSLESKLRTVRVPDDLCFTCKPRMSSRTNLP